MQQVLTFLHYDFDFFFYEFHKCLSSNSTCGSFRCFRLSVNFTLTKYSCVPGIFLPRNSWTAVSIDGSWCFINCNWGARHVKAENQDGAGGLTEDGGRGGPAEGAGGGGTYRKKKREGLRMDSNTHTHYNHVEVLYEPPVPNPEDGYGTLGGVGGRDVSRRNSLEARESSGVPQILAPEEHSGSNEAAQTFADGYSFGDGAHSYAASESSGVDVGHGVGISESAGVRYPSRLPLGQAGNDLTSSGSYTFGMFSGECGPHRPGADTGISLIEDSCMRAKLRGLATPANTSSTPNNNISGSNKNTVLGTYKKDVSTYASPHGGNQRGTYDPSLDNADIRNRTHYVRKLLPCSPGVDATGSNKENASGDRGKDISLGGGGVLTLDGFAGRCLLDAFYQKDTKPSGRFGVPPAGTRLSDGDTASFSSGYSKSSAESCSGISPSQSPFASVSSTPRSGGALSAHSDSSSASCCSTHRDRDMAPSSSSSYCENRISPPLPFFRAPSASFSRLQQQQQQTLYSPKEGYMSSDTIHNYEDVNATATSASFRNSSSSDASSRCSPPPPSVFRSYPYGGAKTSPPSSLFRFATGSNGTAASVTTTAIVTSTLNGPSDDTLGRRNGDRLSPSHADQYRYACR